MAKDDVLWANAVGACSLGDVGPIIGHLNAVADGSKPALTSQQVRDIASMLDLLHARSQKQKRGKPG
jgi:hypothetical protein